MKMRFGIMLALALAMPAGAYAQGIVGGAEEGSANGAAAAGPVGAVVGGAVGGAVGAVTGGVNGLLGLDLKSRFHDYFVSEGHPSYVYQRTLKAGDILLVDNITYYPVPPEFGMHGDYRYAIINDEAVIVDPHTHRIVQVID